MEKEQYENIIELLKRTLKFYSDADNYIQNKNINSELTSMIELDEGKQGTETLKRVEELMKGLQNMDKDYESLIKDVSEQTNQEDIIQKIRENINTKLNDGRSTD